MVKFGGSRRTRQPQQAARIQQPKTARIIEAVNLGVGNRGLLGADPTYASFTRTPGKGGVAARFDSSATGYIEYADNDKLDLTGPMSILIVYETFGTRAGSEHILLAKNNSDPDWYNSPFLLYQENDGKIKLGRHSASGRSWTESSETRADNTLVSAVITSTATTSGAGQLGTVEFYVNGVKTAKAVDFEDGAGGALTGSSNGLKVGGTNTSSATYGLNGQIYAFAIMQGALAESEAISLSRNPWQIFQSRKRQLYVNAVAGGGISGTLSGTLSAATSSATGTVALAGAVSATLGNVTSTSTGAVAIVGALSKTLDAATLSATGVLSAPGTGVVDKTLDNATLSASAKIAIVGAANVNLEALGLSSASAIRINSSLAQTLANATLSATGAAIGAISGVASVTLDSLTLSAAGRRLWVDVSTASTVWTDAADAPGIWTEI